MITTPYLIGPEAYSEKWYALRTLAPERTNRPIVLGGSDAATCLGWNDYETPLELFLRARGEIPPKEATRRMIYGKRFELANIDWYCADEDAKVSVDHPMYFAVDHYFMGVTPDGVRIDRSPKIGVEAKASSRHMRDRNGEDETKYGEPGTDQVPRYVFAQCQQYCAVLGIETVEVTVMFDGAERFTYPVHAEERVIEALVVSEREMAERIVNNDPPEPTWQAEGTSKLLQQMYGFRPKDRATLSIEAARLWAEADRWKEDIRTLNEQITENQNRVLAEMAGAEIGLFPNGRQGVKRIVIADQLWKESDITKAEKSLGTLKRRGHERLQSCRV